MPYLIDGHNLIGSMPDIHLDDPEDELKLIHKVNEFFTRKRISGTVFFDQRGPGMKQKFKVGRLQVEFATPPNTADTAIQLRLRQLKKEASNYIVVSSDHQVQNAAHAAGARILESIEFAESFGEPSAEIDANDKPQGRLSQDDIRKWQKIFKNGEDNR